MAGKRDFQRLLHIPHAVLAVALVWYSISISVPAASNLLFCDVENLMIESVPSIEHAKKYMLNMVRKEGAYYYRKGSSDSWARYCLVDSIVSSNRMQAFNSTDNNSKKDIFIQSVHTLDKYFRKGPYYYEELAKQLAWLSPKHGMVGPTQLEFHFNMLELESISIILRNVSGTHTGMWLFPYKECTDILNPWINQKVERRQFFTDYPRISAKTWINGDSITSPYSDFTYPIHCTQSPLQPIYIRMEYEDPVTEVLVSQVDTFYLNVTK
jgi:hypothetical protein